MSPLTLPAAGLAVFVAFQGLAAYLDYRLAKEVCR